MSASGPPARSTAFAFWLKLGFISFGGPAGQIAIMHRELVEERRWISEKRFLHALNYCMVLPGPEAQQLATYIGWLMHGSVGGIVAGALFVLPSFFLLVALSWLYVSYAASPLLSGVLASIKPAVVAIIFFAAWRIGSRTLKTTGLMGIAAGALVAFSLLQIPFPVILLAAAILGFLGARHLPATFASTAHPGGSAGRHEASWIDDKTTTPDHARFRWTRLAWTLVLTAGLTAIVLFAISAAGGGPLADMARFFTQAALLTFGGAYAVLPYVYQGAVEQFHWLSAGQMMDGLALGETTPGPLIMVVTFVGFLGGWSHALAGPDPPLAYAIAAAGVATFFTFLPSFLFILVGGPLVEATRQSSSLAAPLTAITAAVVGVIVNLGLFLAWKVWWPLAGASAPFSGFDAPAFGITLAALLLLVRRTVGVIGVIGLAAVLRAARSVLA
ncbi:MAG TPA: chromate efflux transporter [Usitatibacteraceae bacterium]|nr:chromate efflux transporter [Usitatibacteraceae bacterium]